MSSVTQIPVYETVCVKTEEKLVGYRDLTGAEAAKEEAFSSGVPSTFGLEDAFTYSIPAVVVPGVYVPKTPHYPTDDPLPTPIPGAILLFGTVLGIYVISKVVRKA